MTDAPLAAAPAIPPVDFDKIDGFKEGIDLRPNGGIHLWIDDEKFRFRRPRAREFRKLREAFQDIADELDEIAIENQRWADDLNRDLDAREKASGERRMTAAEKKEDRTRSRQVTELTEDRMVEWWQLVASTLCERDLPDAEELPVWMGVLSSANEMIGHWRTVPSLSGAR